MFTGIVEETGSVRKIVKRGQSMVLTIAARKVLAGVCLGDSIAVSGVCLTVTSFNGDSLTMDVMPETYRQTSLKQLAVGGSVNLERAMAAGGRFGGHFVQGHVDGTGTIRGIRPEENAVVFEIEPERPELLRFIIPRGSITLDGISLTVVKTFERSFTVSIIPHTLSETVLKYRQAGDLLNIECDMLGKYVAHLLRAGEADARPKREASKLDARFLGEHGFI